MYRMYMYGRILRPPVAPAEFGRTARDVTFCGPGLFWFFSDFASLLSRGSALLGSTRASAGSQSAVFVSKVVSYPFSGKLR